MIDRAAPLLLLLLCASAWAEPSCPKPGAAIEVILAAEPRVELLSVLLLLHEGPGAEARPKSPYQQDAERWFAAYSTHPAVAQAAASLDLSAPPNMIVQDFARASRFTAFYEEHRADYIAFAAQAEKEALSSIHPEAVRAYVGPGLPDRYSFFLAALLPERASVDLFTKRCGLSEAVNLRTSRYSKEGGQRFLFDQLGSSVAHELLRTVIISSGTEGFEASPGLREQLVDAVTLRIIAQDLGEPIYREMLHEHGRSGFLYLEALGERLLEYEAHRDRYKTLKDFYPRLKEVFGKTPSGPARTGPLTENVELRRLKDLGVKDFVEGRFADAAGKFTAALKLAPRDAEAFLDLGVVYEKLDKKTEALESYDRAVEFGDARSTGGLDAKSVALNSRAALLFTLGRAVEARRDLQQARERGPTP